MQRVEGEPSAGESAGDEAVSDGLSEGATGDDETLVEPALDESLAARADAGRPNADAGAPGPADGSSADAGPTDDDPALHPGIGDPAPAPPPLPQDVVAESRLPFHGLLDGEEISARGVWRRLQQSRAICLGELHDNPFHHNLQQRVLERLGELQQDAPAQRGQLAVGYEMIQRPFQEPLSAYLRGELSEQEFLEQTQYEQRGARI